MMIWQERRERSNDGGGCGRGGKDRVHAPRACRSATALRTPSRAQSLQSTGRCLASVPRVRRGNHTHRPLWRGAAHLEVALLVNEEVLWLEVPVQDAPRVQVCESEQELRHEFLCVAPDDPSEKLGSQRAALASVAPCGCGGRGPPTTRRERSNEAVGRTATRSLGSPLFALPLPLTLCGSPTGGSGTLQLPSSSSCAGADAALATRAAASMYFLRSRSRYSKTRERDSSSWMTSRSLGCWEGRGGVGGREGGGGGGRGVSEPG